MITALDSVGQVAKFGGGHIALEARARYAPRFSKVAQDRSATLDRSTSQGSFRNVIPGFRRPNSIGGLVRHGAKLGRTIGFPTANILLGDRGRPAAGIYASISLLNDGRQFPSLSYFGRRPTVDDGDEQLEVFLFDFDEDIYGRRLETVLIRFLRPDERFPSTEAMQQQMERDRLAGRAIASRALRDSPFIP